MSGDPRTVLMSYLSAGNVVHGELGAVSLNVAGRSGQGDLRVVDAFVYEREGVPKNTAAVGQPMVIQLGYKAARPDLITISFEIKVRDRDGRIVTVLSTKSRAQDFTNLQGHGYVSCRIDRCPLPAGRYSIDITASWPGVVLDSLPQALSFDVLPGRYFEGGLNEAQEGIVYVDHAWSSEGDVVPRLLAVPQ